MQIKLYNSVTGSQIRSKISEISFSEKAIFGKNIYSYEVIVSKASEAIAKVLDLEAECAKLGRSLESLFTYEALNGEMGYLAPKLARALQIALEVIHHFHDSKDIDQFFPGDRKYVGMRLKVIEKIFEEKHEG